MGGEIGEREKGKGKGEEDGRERGREGQQNDTSKV